MKNNQVFQINGFEFADEPAYLKAMQEAEAIKYIKQKTDMSDPEAVFDVYLQLLEWNRFETPVGILYLHELREYLCAIPFYKNEEIPAVPVLCHSNAVEQKKTKSRKTPEKQADHKKVPYAWKRVDKMEKHYHISMVWNLILVILVMIMMILTLTTDNVNILNYRTMIINQYESWEKSLDKKEKELKVREEKLRQQENKVENTVTTEQN